MPSVSDGLDPGVGAFDDTVMVIGLGCTYEYRQITRQAERTTGLRMRHGIAVSHIAHREDAAAEHLGPERPAWLPAMPELIRPDVEAARRMPPSP